jgi:hypothetical protein
MIIKNLVTYSDISVTENSTVANFWNQGQSHGTLLFSTIALRLIKILWKGMLPVCNSDDNVGLRHDKTPAHLYSYDNWQLQQEVTLVAGFVTNRTALGVK